MAEANVRATASWAFKRTARRIEYFHKRDVAAASFDLRLGALGCTSIILVLNQYKRTGCSPGKHPDTGTMATGSDDDSRDSEHDRYLCIAV
jgi:hypothetical protein